jgi:hypothetical protein
MHTVKKYWVHTQVFVHRLLVTANVPSLLILVILMMEALHACLLVGGKGNVLIGRQCSKAHVGMTAETVFAMKLLFLWCHIFSESVWYFHNYDIVGHCLRNRNNCYSGLLIYHSS